MAVLLKDSSKPTNNSLIQVKINRFHIIEDDLDVDVSIVCVCVVEHGDSVAPWDPAPEISRTW